jgi:RNA-directed DNA polymerase
MLTALENGVKGGVWYSLIDKVHRPANLYSAFEQVKANDGAAGTDRQTIERFEANLEANLAKLGVELQTGQYRPGAVRRVWIPKPGKKEKRPLGIPTVRDRIVQTALRNVVEPIFEREFAAQSYGFRPNRSTKGALRRVDELLHAGYVHAVDADLKQYFDTIPKVKLMEVLKLKIADGRVLELVEKFLEQAVNDNGEEYVPAAGTPQGAVLSPLLSNLYLNALDHLMERQGYEMVRYADDFVVLCRTQAEAAAALTELQRWTAQAGLTLHPEKTRLVDASLPGGFDFLGYHFERGKHWPSEKSKKKFRDALRPLTARNNGHSLQVIIARINPKLRGWFEYFKHSPRIALRAMDGWTRQRLRNIQRRRHHRYGIASGRDQRRWPNAFFAAHGLFSLEAAHVQHCQSNK